MTNSLNRCIDYYLDSLTGRSVQTRRAYERDLAQFKLYLVLYRQHTLLPADKAKLDKLKAELHKSGGELWDTTLLNRKYNEEIRSQMVLDSIDVQIDLISKADVVGFFGYLETSKGVSRATLLRRLAALRRFFHLLTKEHYPVQSDIMDHLTDMKVKRERKLPIVLSEQESVAFLKVIKNPRDRAIIVIMLFMGLRVSEVVQLNVADIHPNSSGITLRGKGAKERYVPIHPCVHQAIAEYLLVRPDTPSDNLGEPLFVTNRKRRIDTSTVRRFIKKYGASLSNMESRKKRHLSPHKFRHTFATLLLSNSVDIRYIQELLGHENLSTTEIYTTVHTVELDKAVANHPLGNLANTSTPKPPDSQDKSH